MIAKVWSGGVTTADEEMPPPDAADAAAAAAVAAASEAAEAAKIEAKRAALRRRPSVLKRTLTSQMSLNRRATLKRQVRYGHIRKKEKFPSVCKNKVLFLCNNDDRYH